MTDEIRTCIACKHYKGPENIYVAQMQLPSRDQPQCAHPKAASRDMIYGRCFCTAERNNNKGCGKKGKFWEPKDGPAKAT